MRAILFDFDGTIADTLQTAIVLWNEIAAAKGYSAVHPEELPELRHLDLKKLVKRLGVPKRKVPGLLLRGERALRDRIGEIEIFEGMPEVLRSAREEADVLGILTSNSVENVEVFLARHGLEGLFDSVQSTSKLTKKAKYLRRILEDHDIAPTDARYVGDEIRDMKAAHKAGIPAIAVTWGFNSAESLRETGPAHLVSTPAELAALLIS